MSQIDQPESASDTQKESAERNRKVADSDYPSDEVMEDAWNAYEKGGRSGILDFLQRQRRKRKEG